MSSYTNPPRLTRIGERLWRVDVGFEYYIGHPNSGFVVTIPAGFETDLASIPPVLQWLLPPDGTYDHGVVAWVLRLFGRDSWDWRYAHAAIVHDYLYKQAIATKRIADIVFYESMGVSRVYTWLRVLMYEAVRFFGKGNYEKI